MFRRSLTAMTLAAGALVAGVATVSAGPAAAGGSQPATGCQIVSELHREGNTIFTAAETVPCQVPIFVALYRNDVLVAKVEGGAGPHIEFPCTPVSFDVFWKNSRGDHLKTNCF